MDFVNGDAAAPEADGNKTIARVPNDIGAWGAGIDRARDRVEPLVTEALGAGDVRTVVYDRA